MNYKAMWNQLQKEMVALKLKGEDLEKKYCGERSSGKKYNETKAINEVVISVLGRMVGLEIEHKKLDEKKVEVPQDAEPRNQET